MTKPIQITKMPAGDHDAGRCGTPGSDASERIARIYATPRGWEVVLEASDGSNQGYYRQNYGYGPWTARGNTLAGAARKALSLVDRPDCLSGLRTALAAAQAEAAGKTWTSLLQAEIDRVRAVLADPPEGQSRVRIGAHREWIPGDLEAQQAYRRRGLAALERALARAGGPLPGVSDEEILAAARARGLALGMQP